MVSVFPASVNEEKYILSKLNSFKPLLILLNVSGMLPSLTQFRIVSSAIEDIDVLCRPDLAEDECHTFSEETTRNIADTNISSCSSTLDDKERSNSILYLSEMGTQNPALRGYTSTIDATKMMARSSSTVQEFSSEVTYLIKCIRYHQNLLKFCVEVNDFLSNVLLFDLIIFQILMCLPPLQLILGQNVSMLRFVSSIVDTGIWPLLICFWGEALSNQSLSVQRAAYGCSWYNRSQSLKKLLHFFIMRSKKPVRMTAGKFYYISLETFADIENKVYAYFTLLKNST
ncbi:odorant receptor 49b [Cryptotermes secundus]|uniref:odorant receptor 49b n=1 Tax=Cryptotermes secundus TaxID=105785 RepID=UPI001454BA0B|nr:odorant receptor 49b [Cryptotermes secundus]